MISLFENDTYNPLVQKLKDSAPEDVILFLDFDDCLDISTRRDLTAGQVQILRDLERLTNGGVIITTNSDGRTVEKILPGFPIISEYSTVFRNIGDTEYANKNQEINFNDKCRKAFKSACIDAQDLGITVTDSADDLANKKCLKIEEKENGIAIVFGSHADLKSAADSFVKRAFKTCGFSDQFECDVKGKDASEIKMKDAAKVDANIDVEQYDHLKGRSLRIFMGDSGSDYEGMLATGTGIIVGDAITTDKQRQIKNSLHIPSDGTCFEQTWLFLSQWRDMLAAKQTLSQTIVVQPTRYGLGGW